MHLTVPIETISSPFMLDFNSNVNTLEFQSAESTLEYHEHMSWDARLRRRVRELGWSQRELSRRSGVAYENVAKYLKGAVKTPRGTALQKLAEAVGMDEKALLFGDDSGWPHRVPLIGYAGGGESWLPVESDAAAPEIIDIEVDDDDPVAIQVRGGSMWPVYRDLDILVGYRGRGLDLRSTIGHDCIVQTTAGERYVKILQRGNAPGRFRLRSYNPIFDDIDDVSIEWVAPIGLIKRRAAG